MCPAVGFHSSPGTVSGATAAKGGGDVPGCEAGALTILRAWIIQLLAPVSTSIKSSNSFSFRELAESGVPVPSLPFSRKSCSASPFSSSPSMALFS